MKTQALILLAVLSGVTLHAGADARSPVSTHPSSESTRHEQSTLEYSDRDYARQWDPLCVNLTPYSHCMG